MPQGIFTKEHATKVSKALLGHVLSPETKAKIGNAHRGKILSDKQMEFLRTFRLGKKHSPETIERMKAASKIRWSKPHPKVGEYHYDTPDGHHPLYKGEKFCKCGQKLCSVHKTLCRRCVQLSEYTSLSRLIRNIRESREWRDDVFTRDNFICQGCGERGGKLHAHHIKPLAKILREYKITSLKQALDCAELWSINNGATLCVDCHKKTDSYFNKGA